MPTELALFEGQKIRRHYDEKTETWWFSVVDIGRVLAQQTDFPAARGILKQARRLSRRGRPSVGDKLSPTENGRRRWKELPNQTARKYWKTWKGCLAKEDSHLITNCHQLKMPADDGKMCLTSDN